MKVLLMNENELILTGVIFATVKADLTINYIKNIKNEIYERFESFGIKRSVIIKMFNEVERSIEAGESKDSLLEEEKIELEIFIENINEIVKNKM